MKVVQASAIPKAHQELLVQLLGSLNSLVYVNISHFPILAPASSQIFIPQVIMSPAQSYRMLSYVRPLSSIAFGSNEPSTSRQPCWLCSGFCCTSWKYLFRYGQCAVQAPTCSKQLASFAPMQHCSSTYDVTMDIGACSHELPCQPPFCHPLQN